MKKIIRVTESELVKMIGKVINEQQSTPEQAIAREFAVPLVVLVLIFQEWEMLSKKLKMLHNTKK